MKEFFIGFLKDNGYSESIEEDILLAAKFSGTTPHQVITGNITAISNHCKKTDSEERLNKLDAQKTYWLDYLDNPQRLPLNRLPTSSATNLDIRMAFVSATAEILEEIGKDFINMPNNQSFDIKKTGWDRQEIEASLQEKYDNPFPGSESNHTIYALNTTLPSTEMTDCFRRMFPNLKILST